MHLVINASELGRQRGGNESFIAGLIDGLAELGPSARISLLTSNWGRPLSLPPGCHQVNLGGYRRLAFLLWQQTIALRYLNADWYLANFFLPVLMPCKGAVVVHDLSFRAHPEYFPRTVASYMHWFTRLAVQRAGCVLTDSEFSRHELLRFYPMAARKTVTMPMGVGPAFRPVRDATENQIDQDTLSRYGVGRPYILALGNIHPRKNLARLLDAYEQLRTNRNTAPGMVWAGLSRWSSDQLLERAHAAGVVLTGFVAQADLPVLYRQAEMLVYPSLYEGFGLPPLEAMACGTPAITSNTTSLPEVVGDAAVQVDPTNVEQLAAAMGQLLDDTALRQQLRAAGYARAAEFTWRRTAQTLLAALND